MNNKTATSFSVLVCLALAGLIVFVMQLPFAQAYPVDSYQDGWNLVRDTAAEDAAAAPSFTTTGDFANLPSDVFSMPAYITDIPSLKVTAGSRWLLTFAGTDAADETFSYTVVGWSSINGMAQIICEGTGILGTQQVLLYPHDNSTATNGFWADTLVVTDSALWPDTPVVFNSGNNEVSQLRLNLAGIKYLKVYFYDVSGGAEAVNMTVYGRKY